MIFVADVSHKNAATGRILSPYWLFLTGNPNILLFLVLVMKNRYEQQNEQENVLFKKKWVIHDFGSYFWVEPIFIDYIILLLATMTAAMNDHAEYAQ